MARSSKARSKEVSVIIDRPHIYRIDASRSRTLPAGWQGVVPAGVAAEIESDAQKGLDAVDARQSTGGTGQTEGDEGVADSGERSASSGNGQA